MTSTSGALGNTTTTAYTPALGDPPTGEEPEGLATTTTFDPRRGLPTLIIDPNGRRTEATYDTLGRTSEVWLVENHLHQRQLPARLPDPQGRPERRDHHGVPLLRTEVDTIDRSAPERR